MRAQALHTSTSIRRRGYALRTSTPYMLGLVHRRHGDRLGRLRLPRGPWLPNLGPSEVPAAPTASCGRRSKVHSPFGPFNLRALTADQRAPRSEGRDGRIGEKGARSRKSTATPVTCERVRDDAGWRRRETRTFATTNQTLALGDSLAEHRGTCMGKRSTGICWKPICLLEDALECGSVRLRPHRSPARTPDELKRPPVDPTVEPY